MTAAAARPRPGGLQALRRSWDRVSMYVPVILMGVLALGTYWLARNTPSTPVADAKRPARHLPDYFMRGFSVKSFDPDGRLKSEIFGSEARHYPDTDTIEIEQPRIRTFNARGTLTVATANRAISNGDGTQVQLIGNAVVTRDAVKDAQGNETPRLEIKGEFLHAFLDVERVTSNRPVELTRGDDRFSAENLDYDNLERQLDLRGRVRGQLAPREQR